MNLLDYKDNLLFQTKAGAKHIFDPVRSKYVVFTPEELVRQLFIQYLLEEHKISKKHIAVEKQILVADRRFRFDILVFDKQAQPLMIVECKSHNVSINDDTAIQISKYNHVIKSKYICITNGINTYFYVVDYDRLETKKIEKIILETLE